MIETPGSLVREYVTQFSESSGEVVDEWDRGWDAAMRHVCKELENLTSKVEAWEIKQEEKA